MITNGAGRPVVALDIDGTLGDYHGHFLKFAEGWLGCSLNDPTDINPGLPLWEFMGIHETTYRKIKLAYRQGGMKRSMPAYSGVEKLSHLVHNAEADLWICTTRPYMKHDSIDEDTQEWLRRARVDFDGIIYDNVGMKGSKYRELNRQVGERVAAVVDDLPDMLMEISKIIAEGGFKNVHLIGCRDQPYNRSTNTLSMGVTRISSVQAMVDPILDAVRRWKLDNGRRDDGQ